MQKIKQNIQAICDLYVSGFRNMTWGRPLWGLIILKVVILFLVLRLFFFKPAMAGMSEEEKSEQVGSHFIESANKDTISIN